MRRGSAPDRWVKQQRPGFQRGPVGLDGGVQDGVDERVSWCVGADAVGLECRAFAASRDWDGRPGVGACGLWRARWRSRSGLFSTAQRPPRRSKASRKNSSMSG